eukprot:349686-Chlamydomonas_euryale.AAC.12
MAAERVGRARRAWTGGMVAQGEGTRDQSVPGAGTRIGLADRAADTALTGRSRRTWRRHTHWPR